MATRGNRVGGAIRPGVRTRRGSSAAVHGPRGIPTRSTQARRRPPAGFALGHARPSIEDQVANHVSLLARRAEALDDFAALVAHELKHALIAASASSYGESGAIEDAIALVDEILETARAEGDEGSATPEMSLTEALRRLGPIAARIHSILPPRLPMPHRQLTLVLRNLIANALAAGATVVTIEAWRSGSSWVVTMDDDGDGLRPTTTPRMQGNGLGLALCRRIAERRGGALDLQPSPAGGARAILTLPGGGPMIRVVIVDDHSLVRAGMRGGLGAEADIDVVGEADGPEQAIARVRATQPDVVLLDLLMPRANGYETIPRVIKAAPDAKVIVCTAMTGDSAVRRALSAGATGYVAKRASCTDLLDAIRRVAGGERYVDPALGAKLAAPEEAPFLGPVSDRERDVLHLLALGYTNQEIAKMLFISVRTVDTHRAHIMRKLDLETRAELVMFALAHGLIGPN